MVGERVEIKKPFSDAGLSVRALDDEFDDIEGIAFNQQEEEDSYYCEPDPDIVSEGMLSFASFLVLSNEDNNTFSEHMTFTENSVYGIEVPMYDPLRELMDNLIVDISDIDIDVSSRIGDSFELEGATIEGGFSLMDSSSGLELVKLDLVIEGGYVTFNGTYGTMLLHVVNPQVTNEIGSVLLNYFYRQDRTWATPMIVTFQAANTIISRLEAGESLSTTASSTVKAEAMAFPPIPVCPMD